MASSMATAHARSARSVEGDVRGDAPVLECAGLTRRFGDRVAVDDISFRIGQGETYGLLGPNGAGKTTTIRLICGLLRRDAGEVAIAGEPMRGAALEAKSKIGYVPQDVALYPDLTAEENLRFFGRLQRLPRRVLAERSADVLELIGLSDRRRDRVDTFSGGMRRRLNIGVALLHRPSLLILDEPTVGVDPQSRHAILESVASFGGSGMAVLYTTHYMEEAERVCDRIGIVDHGKLIAEGTQRELVATIAGRDRIELAATGDLHALERSCLDLECVDAVTVTDGQVEVIARDARRVLAAVFEAAERNEVNINSAEVVEPDLEAVFLHLTGTALRE